MVTVYIVVHDIINSVGKQLAARRSEVIVFDRDRFQNLHIAFGAELKRQLLELRGVLAQAYRQQQLN